MNRLSFIIFVRILVNKFIILVRLVLEDVGLRYFGDIIVSYMYVSICLDEYSKLWIWYCIIFFVYILKLKNFKE